MFACYEHACGHTKSGRPALLAWPPAGLPLVYQRLPKDYVNTAGPHPFIVAIPDALNPQHPNATRLPDYTFRLNSSGTLDPRPDDWREVPYTSTDIPTQIGWE